MFKFTNWEFANLQVISRISRTDAAGTYKLLTDDGFSAYGILSTTVRIGWLYVEQQQRDIQRQSSIGTKEEAEGDVRRSGVSRRYVR